MSKVKRHKLRKLGIPLVGVATVGLLAVSLTAAGIGGGANLGPADLAESSARVADNIRAEASSTLLKTDQINKLQDDIRRRADALSTDLETNQITSILTGGEHAKSLGIANVLSNQGVSFGDSLMAKLDSVSDRAAQFKDILDEDSRISIHNQQFIWGMTEAKAGKWTAESLEDHIDAFMYLDDEVKATHDAWLDRLTTAGVSEGQARLGLRSAVLIAMTEFKAQNNGALPPEHDILPAELPADPREPREPEAGLDATDMQMLQMATFGMMDAMRAKMNDLQMSSANSTEYTQVHFNGNPTRNEVMGKHYAAIMGIAEGFMDQGEKMNPDLAMKVMLAGEIGRSTWSSSSEKARSKLDAAKTSGYLDTFRTSDWDQERLEEYVDITIDTDITVIGATESAIGYMRGKVSDPEYVIGARVEMAWQAVSQHEEIVFEPLDSDLYEYVTMSPDLDKRALQVQDRAIAGTIQSAVDQLHEFEEPRILPMASFEVDNSSARSVSEKPATDPFNEPVADPFEKDALVASPEDLTADEEFEMTP